MKKVLVTIPLKEEHKRYLESIHEELEFTYCTRREAAEKIGQAQVILGNVKPGCLKEAGKLEFLQLDSAGAVEYVQPGVLPEGVRLANATGAYGQSIAEYMVGMVFTLKKKLYLYEKNQRNHEWKDEGMVPSITGSTTMVIGMGDIGSQFALRMNALGSHVYGIRRNAARKPEYLDGIFQLKDLDTLLPKADIVACSLPGTEETYHLMDASKLRRMKKNSVLINVGRGNLVPSADLAAALTDGLIGAAGIDVAEQEPLPADSPLWEVPNLLITPHVSGSYHTEHILDTIVKIAGENLSLYVRGEALKNEVDFKTGYRKYTE